MKTPKQVLQDWVSADRDDAENHQVAFGDPLNGREGLLESLVTFLQAFRDNYTHAENLFEDREWAIVEWTGSGTFLGEFGGNLPTGKSFTLQGCGFFHVVDGKIHFQRGYIDKHTWFMQLGLPISEACSCATVQLFRIKSLLAKT